MNKLASAAQMAAFLGARSLRFAVINRTNFANLEPRDFTDDAL